MIGYEWPILTATVPMVKPEFDFTGETAHEMIHNQVKHHSLDDYDHSNYDEEGTEIVLGLDRWGDRRVRGGRND